MEGTSNEQEVAAQQNIARMKNPRRWAEAETSEEDVYQLIELRTL